MELYLLRHGEADWPDWNKSDDERPLTKRGKKEMQEVAKFLGRLKVRPDLIVTSPLPRASQTAEIAADYLKAKGRIARARIWDERTANGAETASRKSLDASRP